MEYLDRGLVAVPSEAGILVSWRVFGTDPEEVTFDLYRMKGDDAPVKLNEKPIDGASNFLDEGMKPDGDLYYTVRAYHGQELLDESSPVRAWENAHLSIPLRTPEGYSPNDASVGDLTGDGKYEIVVHMTGVGRDNSHKGMTDEPILQAYTLEGDFFVGNKPGQKHPRGSTLYPVYGL